MNENVGQVEGLSFQVKLIFIKNIVLVIVLVNLINT